jgi:DNA-binding protein HU-beta
LRIAAEVIVNRSQLVRTVSESTTSTRKAVDDVVDVLFGTIVTEVRSGRKVTVVGFGAFNPIDRGPRVGRNPRTGAVVPIPASKGVRFATGSAFKSALNPKEEASMAVRKAAAKRPARKRPAKKTAARKATAKRAVKKAPARKSAAKKSAAKRTAKRAPARKRPAKKAAAKRTTKRAPARKRPAKKAAAKRTTKRAAAKKRPAKKAAAKRTTKRAPARKAAKRTVRRSR